MDEARCREEKKALRAEVARRVADLTEEYMAQSDSAIAGHVLAMPEYKAAKAVFCFVSMEREVQTRPILLDALKTDKRVGVPLCTGKGIMEIREIKTLDDLTPGYRGILEPKQECPLMSAEEISFAVIPCVSCDREGRRLGHGGGYYDRYLERAVFSAAIVCRERTLCDAVPVEAHDIPVKLIVTERGVVRL